jgi:hypothetical protein
MKIASSSAMGIDVILEISPKFSCMSRELIERIARIEPTQRQQLVRNLGINGFEEGLETLIKHGVSVEEFATFESYKQSMLATEHWLLVLFISGIEAEKITQLSVENLTSLDIWLKDQDLSQSPTWGMGWPESRIQNNDLDLVNKKLNYLASNEQQRNESGPSRGNSW